MILVDTSVIADIFTKDPDWFQWSSSQIERAASEGPIARDPRRVRTFFPSVRLITP